MGTEKVDMKKTIAVAKEVAARSWREEEAAKKIVLQLIHLNYSTELPVVRLTDYGVAILWDSGPYEWPTNDGYWLFEELKGYGMPGEFKDFEHKTLFYPPKGFETEPVNNCVLLVREV